ncbi:MAG: hypothetical protein ACKODX_14435, partial [Gemmata sp.]
APVAAAETVAADARPWYKKLFVSAPKPVGPVARSGPVTAAPRPAPLAPDVVQSMVQAEADALLRRMTVCTELRRVAFDKNDDALMRQVDELERQAKAVYEARVAALGISKTVKAPLPVGSGAVASFDLAPEKPLDPKAAAAKLVAPAAPVPVSGTAEVIRTVKPEGQP